MPNASNNNRAPYRSFDRAQQRPRVYQASVKDEENSQEQPYDKQANYNAYEEDFYQSTNWENSGHPEESQENGQNSGNIGNDGNDTVETHFLSVQHPAKAFKCRKCSSTFPSNNALHNHLRQGYDKTRALMISSSRIAQASSDACRSLPHGSPSVIQSTSKDSASSGYAFRGYHFITALVRLSSTSQLQKLCVDTSYTISLVDRTFLLQQVPNAEILKMPMPIRVRGIGDKKHNASHYTKLQMYLPATNGATALIKREVHIVDNLSANTLISVNILKPEGMIIDLDKNLIIIQSCQNLEVPIKASGKGSRTNTTVFSQAHIVVAPHTNKRIQITGPRHRALRLPTNRDLIFKPEKLDSLSVYAHVVDCHISHIFIRNDTNEAIKLPRNVKLGHVTEYEAAECFPVKAFHSDLAARPPKKARATNWVKSNLQRLVAAAAAFTAVVPTISTAAAVPEAVHSTGATIYGCSATRPLITEVINRYPALWQDTSSVANIPEAEWMDIPLVDNWPEIYKPGQARVYPLGQADKEVINAEFDKLHGQGRIDWTAEATPFSFPYFIVWKAIADGTRKGRVIVDIRALNKITMPDAYPVPSQAEILALLKGATHISTVDAASFFYQ